MPYSALLRGLHPFTFVCKHMRRCAFRFLPSLQVDAGIGGPPSSAGVRAPVLRIEDVCYATGVSAPPSSVPVPCLALSALLLNRGGVTTQHAWQGDHPTRSHPLSVLYSHVASPYLDLLLFCLSVCLSVCLFLFLFICSRPCRLLASSGRCRKS